MIKWIWSGFNQRNEDQRQIIMRCQGLYPFIETVEKITQEFRILFENRNVEGLIVWINTQLANRTNPFYSYSSGLRLDIAAVKNAFISPYSNGLLYGQVNRLKMGVTNDVRSRKARFTGKTVAISILILF